MKIYTQTFDVAKQSPKRFWVAPFSDFKIGVKIVKNGTPIGNEFTVKKGTTTLTPDEDLVDGFKTYTIKSGATGFEEYTVEISGVGEAQKLTQIITDSTVFDIDAAGGDIPADVATQTWVNSQISDFITDDALTAYVPLSGNVNMTGSLSVAADSNGVYLDPSNGVTVWDADEGKQKIVSLDYDGLFVKGYNDSAAKEIEYPTKSGTMLVDTDLTAYYTKSETSSAIEGYVSAATSSFITAAALEPYATASDIASTYATKTELSDYATTSAMTSAISAATSNKVTGGAIGLAPALSSVIAVYASAWATLSATADENTMYVVLPDPVLLTRVKYTTSSGLPDWEGDIVGQIMGGDGTPTTQIPNVSDIEEISFGSHVTSIDQSAFVYCDNIKSVTIPNGVTTIGANVFEGCTAISSITIPDSVTSIGEGAFYECTGLTSVSIGNGVTSIGYGAFASCSNLTSVTIPGSVTMVDNGAFMDCTSLTSVTVENGVTSLGDYSFQNCSSLSSFTMTSSVTNLGDIIFDGCTNLMSVTWQGITVAEVQAMDLSSCGFQTGCVIHCTDGDITVS